MKYLIPNPQFLMTTHSGQEVILTLSYPLLVLRPVIRFKNISELVNISTSFIKLPSLY